MPCSVAEQSMEGIMKMEEAGMWTLTYVREKYRQ
jgi:hypothetical protein